MKTRRWSTDGHIESKSIVVTGFRVKTPHGASLLQTDIQKFSNFSNEQCQACLGNAMKRRKSAKLK